MRWSHRRQVASRNRQIDLEVLAAGTGRHAWPRS